MRFVTVPSNHLDKKVVAIRHQSCALPSWSSAVFVTTLTDKSAKYTTVIASPTKARVTTRSGQTPQRLKHLLPSSIGHLHFIAACVLYCDDPCKTTPREHQSVRSSPRYEIFWVCNAGSHRDKGCSPHGGSLNRCRSCRFPGLILRRTFQIKHFQ